MDSPNVSRREFIRAGVTLVVVAGCAPDKTLGPTNTGGGPPPPAGDIIIDAPLQRMVAINPILANTNIPGSWDELKDGPSWIVRVGPGDYRMVFEGVAASSATSTGYATSTNAMRWTKYASNPVFTATQQWENRETSIGSVVWDPIAKRWNGYYHGGNNTTPRQIGLATSPDLLSWTRYSNSPILAKGASGTWEDRYIADAKVIRVSATDWRMIYRGVKASTNVAQVGYATSSDGVNWTKYPANPVFGPAASGWDSTEILSPSVFIDVNGRFHMWYVGSNQAAGSSGNGLGYAYSDDFINWTRGSSNPVLLPTGNASDPDQAIGDTTVVFDDGDVVFVNCLGFNPNYQGNRLEGRVQAWTALPASQPTRPGRHFRPNSRLTVPASAGLLGQTQHSIYVEFKAPTHNTNRVLYAEAAGSNQQIAVRIDTSGLMQCTYQTPSGAVTIASTNRVDDNMWHRVSFVRHGLTSFELMVDGGSVARSTSAPGTDSATTAPSIGNWSSSLGKADEAAMSTIRRVLLVAGYDMSSVDDATLWNGGNAGGLPPSSGVVNLDLLPGSGGAGADKDASKNSYMCSVSGPAVVVEARLLAALAL